MAKNWTDERLEERFGRIDLQHDRFDADFRELRAEMNAHFDAVDQRFDAMNARFDAVDTRFDAMNARFDATLRLMIQIGGGMIATVLAGFLGVIATQL